MRSWSHQLTAIFKNDATTDAPADIYIKHTCTVKPQNTTLSPQRTLALLCNSTRVMPGHFWLYTTHIIFFYQYHGCSKKNIDEVIIYCAHASNIVCFLKCSCCSSSLLLEVLIIQVKLLIYEIFTQLFYEVSIVMSFNLALDILCPSVGNSQRTVCCTHSNDCVFSDLRSLMCIGLIMVWI